MHKRKNVYALIIICLTFILPILFTIIEWFTGSVWILSDTFYKWFVFFALGLRLFSAGLTQLFKPTYTLHTVFKINDIKSAALVQELGVHNALIGFALMSMIVMPGYRDILTSIGAAYFGIAGLLHATRKEKAFNQYVAMMADLVIAVITLFFLWHKLYV